MKTLKFLLGFLANGLQLTETHLAVEVKGQFNEKEEAGKHPQTLKEKFAF